MPPFVYPKILEISQITTNTNIKYINIEMS